MQWSPPLKKGKIITGNSENQVKAPVYSAPALAFAA